MASVKIVLNNGQEKIIEKRLARLMVHRRKAVYADSYEKKVIEPKDYVKKKLAQSADNVPDADLLQAREEYQKIMGKKPFHGWGVEQLLAKIKGEE